MYYLKIPLHRRRPLMNYHHRRRHQPQANLLWEAELDENWQRGRLKCHSLAYT
jgi:hypothetical protein